jgi:hypothetical protein
MATTVCGALVDLWNADGTLPQLVPSGLWVGQVPELLALPYVCALHQGEVPQWATDTFYLEETKVAFHCLAETAAKAEAIQLAVKALYDWNVLMIDNATTVSVRRTNYRLTAEATRAPDAEIVYRGVVEYAVLIARPKVR